MTKMFEKYFGLIELAVSFTFLVGFCLWQLWAVERAMKKAREEQAKHDDET